MDMAFRVVSHDTHNNSVSSVGAHAAAAARIYGATGTAGSQVLLPKPALFGAMKNI